MAGTPSTTSGNVDGKGASTMKFLCSYGGKILPRHLDGKLRYVGGETRVLSVNRSISFAELAERLGELCGEIGSVIVKCRLPTDDLDYLILVTSDEELRDLIEEYDRFNRDRPFPLMIRCFLWPRRIGVKTPPSPPPSLIPVKSAYIGKSQKTPGKMFIPVSAATGSLHRILAPARIHSHHQR